MADLTQRLKNKTILVTAVSAGIGHGSVLRMASEGARVVATDVDASALPGSDLNPHPTCKGSM
jgi:2-keto-3-deoxy-L-fuconate dehydrogenase